MTISVDAEYLEELEKKAKKHDFFEGYIKGIEVAFAFAEELVKNIGNCKIEPKTTDYCDACNHKGCDNCVADGSNPYCVPSQFEPKDEPQTERPSCETCKWDSEEWYDSHCDSCVAHTDKPSNYESKDEPQTKRSE